MPAGDLGPLVDGWFYVPPGIKDTLFPGQEDTGPTVSSDHRGTKALAHKETDAAQRKTGPVIEPYNPEVNAFIQEWV